MLPPDFEVDGVRYPIYRPPTNVQYKEIPEDRYFVRKAADPNQIGEFRRRGLEAIANGRLCVLVLCGGQASRLGALKPKGTLSMQLGGRFDTLLRLQAGQIIRLLQLAKQTVAESSPRVTWAVMVSRSTEDEVRRHLNAICSDFNLPNEDVIVFKQKESPCFDRNGRVLYKSHDQVQTAPDGNGGLYEAIRAALPGKEGQTMMSELDKRGIEYFHVYCVDNILCRVGDPTFVGFSILKGADCVAKVVEKRDPHEKVGVICMNGDKPIVVEYSEITKQMAEQRTPDKNKLAFRAGNIANHFFTMKFMKLMINHRLNYHVAEKKINHFDRVTGQMITPTEPNGYKLELFIFDVFPLSRNFYVFQVEPTDEFSPLKNDDSTNVDCPKTCRRDLANLHAKWLRDAKVQLHRPLYVSPLISYEGEELNNAAVKKTIVNSKNEWIDL